MTTDEETETETMSKTDLQLSIIAIGATQDNEMKIFKIITLRFHKTIYDPGLPP